MDSRSVTVVCLLVAALMCLIPATESYPELFVYLHSKSCSDIPQQSYAGHGAPIMDSGVAFEVVNTPGLTTASPAKGQKYSVKITFTTPRYALVTASKGELFQNDKPTPGYRDCPNRLIFSPAVGLVGPQSTLRLGLWLPDTVTGSSVTLTVVSASSEVSPYMIATLTMPMSSASAHLAPGGTQQRTTQVQPASVTSPGPTPTPQAVRPAPAIQAVSQVPSTTPAIQPAPPPRPTPHPAPALPSTAEPARASQLVRPTPALQTVRVAVQQAMASLPPTAAQPAPPPSVQPVVAVIPAPAASHVLPASVSQEANTPPIPAQSPAKAVAAQTLTPMAVSLNPAKMAQMKAQHFKDSLKAALIKLQHQEKPSAATAATAATASVSPATPAPAQPAAVAAVPAPTAAAAAPAAADAMQQTMQILADALQRLKQDKQQKQPEPRAAPATAAGIVQQAMQGKAGLISAGIQKLRKPLFISAVLHCADVPAKKPDNQMSS